MYNGTIGGIGEGLQSFVTAYQTALNYQLEKAKAANLAAYQQQMADVANKNSTIEGQRELDQAKYQGTLGEVAQKNAGTEAAKQLSEAEYQRTQGRSGQLEAISKLVGEGGTPALEALAPDMIPGQGQQQAPAPAPAAPQPQARGLINPLPPGLMGPQPSPQMVDESQNRANQGMNGLMGPVQPPGMLQGQMAGTTPTPSQTQRLPYIPSTLERNQNFALAEKGLIRDPQTGNVQYIQDPRGDMAKLEAATKTQQLINEKTGQRTGYGAVVNQFQDAIKPALDAQTYMAQAIKAYPLAVKEIGVKGNTHAQSTLFESVAKAQGLESGDVKKVVVDGGASQTLRNAASQFIDGTVDKKTLDDLMRDAHESFSARMGSVQANKPLYKKRALQAQADPNLVTATPALDKTMNDSSALLNRINGPVGQTTTYNGINYVKVPGGWKRVQ